MVRFLISKKNREIPILLFDLSKDIGALSEEHFDAVDWINKTLKKSEEQQNKEV